jgi:hypothetical protein
VMSSWKIGKPIQKFIHKAPEIQTYFLDWKFVTINQQLAGLDIEGAVHAEVLFDAPVMSWGPSDRPAEIMLITPPRFPSCPLQSMWRAGCAPSAPGSPWRISHAVIQQSSPAVHTRPTAGDRMCHKFFSISFTAFKLPD